jgi:hypothetical protein
VKILIALAIAIIVILAMVVPAMAADVTTGVTVLSGNGVAPIVKAKWESTPGPSALTADVESGDPTHLVTGTQVAPIPGFQATAPVIFWAIVTDPAGVANISHVYADVNYPASGADPGPNSSLKFELELQLNATDGVALTAFNAANAAHLVTLGSGITVAEIQDELNQGTARLFWGTFPFDNCELTGNYPVTINAVNGQNVHGMLGNTLAWLPLTAAAFDFSAVNYGSVAIGVHKQIDGDRLWSTSGIGPATVENTGNTYLQVTVKQDDMGFGKTTVGGVSTWNVHYDGRLDTGAFVNFDPAVVKGGNLAAAPANTMPEILRLCALEKIDFSILVDKDPSSTHAYSGLMILGAIQSAGPADTGVVYMPPTAPPTEQ